MNEHAGAGCLISVLVVVIFTLVFHEAERPLISRAVRSQAATVPPSVASKPTIPHRQVGQARPLSEPALVQGTSVSTGSAPLPAPLVPLTPSGPVRTAAAVSLVSNLTVVATPQSPADQGVTGSRSVALLTSAPPAISADTPPNPLIRQRSTPQLPKRSPAAPRRPQSSCTTIEPGERLVDVAVRVYGTPDAALTIWRANRDRLKGIEAPVEAGCLIRTP